MRKHTNLMIALTISLITFSCHQSELETWKDLVDNVVEQHEIENGPGGVVAIARGNQIVYSKSFGYADVAKKIPNTANTLFDIASCTKQFTAASILILEERGMLDLDTPLQSYFPEFLIKEPIPIRSLLTHSSGIHDYSEMLILARGRSESATFSKQDVLTTIYRQTNLSFLPLTDEKYSNSNFVLLAELVERISHLPYEEFVSQNIFNPLEITSSEIQFLGAETVDSINLAIGYPYRQNSMPQFIAENFEKKQDNPDMEIDHILGASGMKANINGLVKWMGNFKSGKIGTSSLIELLLKRDTLITGTPTTFARGLESGAVPQGYTWIEHTGRNNFTSVMVWWPDFDISMIALTNTPEIWAQAMTNAFCMDILANLPPPKVLFRKKKEVLKQENQNTKLAEGSQKPAIDLSTDYLAKFVGTFCAEAAVGGRRPPSGGVGVNKISLEDGRLVGIRYDGVKFNLVPVSSTILMVESSPIEFHFVDLESNKPGFRFVNLQEEINSKEIAYRIPKLSPNELEQFCGTYRGPTLINSIPIEILCKNEKLFMKWGIEKNLAPLYYLEDGRLTTYVEGPIDAMQCNLVLKWNGKGEIIGFNYDGHRVWNLYFEKQQNLNNLEI